MDTGAEQPVAGALQTKAYLDKIGKTWHPSASKSFFKFGDSVYQSIGRVPIRIPTPQNGIMEFNLDVVQANLPIIGP